MTDKAHASLLVVGSVFLGAVALQEFAIALAVGLVAGAYSSIMVAAPLVVIGKPMHALLWGVMMALLSLLPAVGAALVWFPVAVYFLATGAVWQGIVLIAYGGWAIQILWGL